MFRRFSRWVYFTVFRTSAWYTKVEGKNHPPIHIWPDKTESLDVLCWFECQFNKQNKNPPTRKGRSANARYFKCFLTQNLTFQNMIWIHKQAFLFLVRQNSKSAAKLKKILWRNIPTKRVFDFPAGQLQGRLKGSEIYTLRVKAKTTRMNRK